MLVGLVESKGVSRVSKASYIMYKFGGSCSLGRVVVGSQGQDLGNKQRQARERDTEETDRQTRERKKI